MGYFKTTISGVSWSVLERWVIRGLTFVRVIILARILLPQQFGTFGIAVLILGLAEVFTETAINYFLVQESSAVDDYVDTAWCISIVRGVAISLFMFLLSPLISRFFNSPDSLLVLRFMSLVPLVRGFINPSIIRLQKDLEFRREFWVRSLLFLTDAVTAVVLALIYQNPLSLVAGIIVSGIFEVLASFVLFRPRARFRFSWPLAKIILVRGKWITLASIFSYLYQNGDNLVVGKLLGEKSLGFYDYAYKLSSLPITEISDVVARVSFPVYVKIGHDIDRLRRGFFKTTLIVSLFSASLGLVIFFFARPIVVFILGSRWYSAIPALQILSLGGIAKSITGAVYPLLLAAKRNDYVAWITLVSLLGLLITIYPLVQMWGIVGAGVASIIGAFCSLPLSVYYTNRIISHAR
jgi:lipopolysaccharide exporter